MVPPEGPTWRSDAVERRGGLGRRLLWPVVTFTEIVYFAYVAKSDSYVETAPGPATLSSETIDALRRHSRVAPLAHSAMNIEEAES